MDGLVLEGHGASGEGEDGSELHFDGVVRGIRLCDSTSIFRLEAVVET